MEKALQYIEGNGLIHTDYLTNNNPRFVFKYAILSFNELYGGIMGSKEGYSYTNLIIFRDAGSENIGFKYGTSPDYTLQNTIKGQPYTFDLSREAICVDDTCYGVGGVMEQPATNPFYINGGQGMDLNPNVGRFYFLRIYEGDTLVKEYLPYIVDGVVGVKDTISGTFFPPVKNSFTAGPEAHVFKPSSRTLNFDYSASTTTLTISADTSWSCTTPTFATFSTTSGNSGTTNITISCPNNSGDSREQIINFVDAEEYSFSVKIIQEEYAITRISRSMFQNSGIKTITLPAKINFIDNYAFAGCSALTQINRANSQTEIGLGTYAFQGVGDINKIKIDKYFTNLPQGCFMGARIKNFTCNSEVTSTGYQSFKDTQLTAFTFNEGFQIIQQESFKNCTGLTKVVIPSTIIEILGEAFMNCPNILEYDFSSCESIPTLGNINVFDGINQNCKIYVPSNLIDSWKVATNWAYYADYFQVKQD